MITTYPFVFEKHKVSFKKHLCRPIYNEYIFQFVEKISKQYIRAVICFNLSIKVRDKQNFGIWIGKICFQFFESKCWLIYGEFLNISLLQAILTITTSISFDVNKINNFNFSRQNLSFNDSEKFKFYTKTNEISF